MSQSKRMSLVEAVTYTTVGYALALGASWSCSRTTASMPPALPERLAIGAVFVVLSLVLSYVLRRAFAGRLEACHRRKTPSPGPMSLRSSAASPTRLSEADYG